MKNSNDSGFFSFADFNAKMSLLFAGLAIIGFLAITMNLVVKRYSPTITSPDSIRMNTSVKK